MGLREQKYYMGWLIVSLNNEVGEMLMIALDRDCVTTITII